VRSVALVLVVSSLGLAGLGWRASRSSGAEPLAALNCPDLVGIVDTHGERLACGDDPEAAECARRNQPLVPGDRHRGCVSLGPLRGAVLRLHGLPIDVNRATADDLRALPGVGAGLALRLVEERARAPYCRPADLERVSGIGPRRSAALAPELRFVGAGCRLP
jgi:hypothetical protein